jgi:hypothetical protein
MLAERRCVSRTPARTGDDHLRRPTLEARREFGQRLYQPVLLPPDCFRGLSNLIGHPYFDLAHALLRYECNFEIDVAKAAFRVGYIGRSGICDTLKPALVSCFDQDGPAISRQRTYSKTCKGGEILRAGTVEIKKSNRSASFASDSHSFYSHPFLSDLQDPIRRRLGFVH